MTTVIWIALIIMSPFILMAVLAFVLGLAAVAVAIIVLLSEVWTGWRGRKQQNKTGGE